MKSSQGIPRISALDMIYEANKLKPSYTKLKLREKISLILSNKVADLMIANIVYVCDEQVLLIYANTKVFFICIYIYIYIYIYIS